MGLSPYPSPSDAGVLCVILVNTAMSISIMKEIVRSILHVIGIHVASWEDYSNNQTITESVECRGTPSETYMEEFRSRTPSILYDSLCRCTKQECSVCLVEFKPDAEINQLSCGHVFHKCCVEKWLKYWNVTCPLCRNDMMMMPKEVEENTCPMWGFWFFSFSVQTRVFGCFFFLLQCLCWCTKYRLEIYLFCTYKNV